MPALKRRSWVKLAAPELPFAVSFVLSAGGAHVCLRLIIKCNKRNTWTEFNSLRVKECM